MALDKRQSKYVEKKKRNASYEAYALVGFPYAFQIWAYNVIPLLGMKYVSRIGRSFPIILNWTGTASPKYTKIQSLLIS